jgi:hypothetical protein
LVLTLFCLVGFNYWANIRLLSNYFTLLASNGL